MRTAITPQPISAILWVLCSPSSRIHEEAFGLELQGLCSEIWVSKQDIVSMDFKVGEAARNRVSKQPKLSRRFLNVLDCSRMFQTQCPRMSQIILEYCIMFQNVIISSRNFENIPAGFRFPGRFKMFQNVSEYIRKFQKFLDLLKNFLFLNVRECSKRF